MEWRLYAWTDNLGWPRSVEIFQQRMCFGGTSNNPQTVWFSKTAISLIFLHQKRLVLHQEMYLQLVQGS